MAADMIPSFDPGRPGKQRRGGRRSLRLVGLLLGAISTVVILIVAQRVVSAWWFAPSADAAQKPVEVSKAQPAIYKITVPKVVQVAASVPPPAKLEAPEPVDDVSLVAPQPPEQQQMAAVPSRAPARQRQLPSTMTWQINAEAPKREWFADGRRPMLAKGCALRPGASLIYAVLNTVIQSEVAGQVISTVSDNVYDADGVGRVLIPQGTKLVGLYKSDLTLGSRRLGMVWTEAVMPDGTQITLADANGMDAAGSMAVGGTVSTNWPQIVLTAAVFSLIDAAQMSTVPDGNAYASALADSTINQFSRTGQQVIAKMLDQAVKIRIPAGTPVVVSVGQTVRVC